MTFDEWWLKLKPTECDELKEVFRECWEESEKSIVETLFGSSRLVERFSMTAKPDPSWVCHDCGSKAQPDKDKIFAISTYHDGDKCDVCGEEKATTQPRDFGYPEFK